MLSILTKCQKSLDTTTRILEETRYLHQHLDEKRTPYIPVAIQAAKLYEIIQRMCVLSPLYYMPLDVFLKIFVDNLRSRDRGKGAQGGYLFSTEWLCQASPQHRLNLPVQPSVEVKISKKDTYILQSFWIDQYFVEIWYTEFMSLESLLNSSPI